MTDKKIKKITALIPCYNEANGIKDVINSFPKEKIVQYGYELEIIVTSCISPLVNWKLRLGDPCSITRISCLDSCALQTLVLEMATANRKLATR